MPTAAGAEQREQTERRRRAVAASSPSSRRLNVGGDEPIFGPGDERRQRGVGERRWPSFAAGEARIRPGKGISVRWSTTSAPSAELRPSSAGEKSVPDRTASPAERNPNPKFYPIRRANGSQSRRNFGPIFVVASCCSSWRIRRAASSISAAVVVAPKLNRSALEITASSQAHRDEHRRGFAGAAGACGAGRAGDAGLVEGHEERLPIEADEGDVRRVRQALGVGADDDWRLGQPARIVRLEVGRGVRACARRARAARACHSSSARHMPTARATDSVPGRRPACWKPPKSCGCKFDVVAHDERADAERAVEFVGGDGHRGDAELAEVDGQFADGLGGVGVQRDAAFVADRGEFGDGLQDAGFVVGRAWRRRGAYRGGAGRASRSTRMTPLASTARRSTAWPRCCEFVGEGGDAGVFDGGDDEVRVARHRHRRAATARRQCGSKTSDCQVVGFGAAAGEDHAVGVGPVVLAPSSSAMRSRASSRMRRARRPNSCWLAGFKQRLGPAGAHRFDDFRQSGRRGVVVEIDRLGHALHDRRSAERGGKRLAE